MKCRFHKSEEQCEKYGHKRVPAKRKANRLRRFIVRAVPIKTRNIDEVLTEIKANQQYIDPVWRRFNDAKEA